MALGMALIAGGVLWATQVPVHGHFWSALAGPFFVAGAGTAFGFVPISIAGLAGVSGPEAGLASGLLNTSQQLGGAIGVAAGTAAELKAGIGRDIIEVALADGGQLSATPTTTRSTEAECVPLLARLPVSPVQAA